MRITAIQMTPGADKAHNLAQAARLIAAACDDAPDIVALPEMWTCLGSDQPTKIAAAEEISDPPPAGSAQALLANLARRHAIILHGGSIAEAADGTLYNTSLVYGPDGKLIGRYRKIHLFDITTPSGAGYRESRHFGAGTEIVTVPTPLGALGLSVCYDIRFPELYLTLRRAGADLIFVPAAFTAETGRDHWEVLLRARAIETQTPICAAATCGVHHDAAGNPRETWGHSMIIDAWGQVRGRLAAEPGLLCAEIDPDHTARVRGAVPMLSHRRLV
jgi:nitrilase